MSLVESVGQSVVESKLVVSTSGRLRSVVEEHSVSTESKLFSEDNVGRLAASSCWGQRNS